MILDSRSKLFVILWNVSAMIPMIILRAVTVEKKEASKKINQQIVCY